MRYTIFSVDDRRSHYTTKIRNSLDWEQVATECVDGRVREQLEAAQQKHPYPVNFDAKVGHLGIWYTVLNSFEHAPLVTFEDDAMLGPDFVIHFGWRVAELPEDFDFFSLFLPRDSDHMYNPSLSSGNFTCRTYQRYGGVSMFYSKQGVEKIRRLLERDGFTGQYDDTLYAYAKSGELNGYCSKPNCSDLVYISGVEPSIVQETEKYDG
ncbi:glycosyltransferase [Streptomyces phage Circinus]|uniref:Glycosyltransferase n=1 Tax=Streptomyces phage Circinus TaxID=2562189 RepID=A0A4D6E164_9CAUD|nr:glycosyltransferase [Streptomyces phage Circinus]